MKRKNNGLIVGTILIVLVGALVFIQFLNQEPEADSHAGPVPTAPPSGPAGAGPRVDEHLDNGGQSRAPVLVPQ